MEWVKFSGISWTHDGEGFFYSCYPRPAGLAGDKSAGTEVDTSKGQMVKYHRLGTPCEEEYATALLAATLDLNPKS